MLTCPKCGEYFGFGWPCVSELLLFMLWQGRWKCANCGIIVICDTQIVHLTDEQMNKIAEEYHNANL